MRQQGWDSLLGEFADGWRVKDYVLLSEVIRLNHLRGTLLDVGCAVGDGFEVLLPACSAITSFTGCDFSPEGISAVQRRFPGVEAFVHDLAEPFSDQWDNVICLQTIEHLPDPAQAITHLLAASRGTVVVSTPYKNRRPDPDHRWSFDERDFSGHFDGWTLDSAGRNIFWYRSTGPGLLRPRWRRAVLRKSRAVRRRFSCLAAAKR